MSPIDDNYAADKGVFNSGVEYVRRERKNYGSISEPGRDIPLFAHTDVMVVGETMSFISWDQDILVSMY